MVLRSPVGADGAGELDVVELLLQAPSPMTAVAAIAVIAMVRDFGVLPGSGITLSGWRWNYEIRDPIGAVARVGSPTNVSARPTTTASDEHGKGGA